MTEPQPRRNEKEEEKREKEDEKRGEKNQGWDEKMRHDPVRAMSLAAVLIWGGIVALIEVTDIVTASWWRGWPVFLAGVGIILLVKAAYRLRPEYRRPAGGTVILGIILLGVGVGDIIGWSFVWPVILILIGAIIIARAFFRSRK